jgi:hypothetical protein
MTRSKYGTVGAVADYQSVPSLPRVAHPKTASAARPRWGRFVCGARRRQALETFELLPLYVARWRASPCTAVQWERSPVASPAPGPFLFRSSGNRQPGLTFDFMANNGVRHMSHWRKRNPSGRQFNAALVGWSIGFSVVLELLSRSHCTGTSEIFNEEEQPVAPVQRPRP